MRLRNMSVRAKVLLIVFVGVFFQLVIAATGIYYLNRANLHLTTTVDLDAAAVRQSGRVRSDFLELLILEKNMILSKKEAVEAQYRADFDSMRLALENDLRALRETVAAGGQRYIDEFSRHSQLYLEDHRQIRELSSRNEDTEAMELSTGAARQHTAEARAALTALRDELESKLQERKVANDSDAQLAISLMLGVLAVTLLVTLGLGFAVTGTITRGLDMMVKVADSIAGGNLDSTIETSGHNEIAKLARSVQRMQSSLREAGEQREAQDHLKTGLARLNDVMRGDLDLRSLASKIINEVATFLDAKIGAFYVLNETRSEPTLLLLGTYAYTPRKDLPSSFKVGEGLVGQAALERKQILVRNLPNNYLRITSGLGEVVPSVVSVTPFLYEENVRGVLEIGTLGELSGPDLEYLHQAMPAIAITLETAQRRDELARSLEHSQQLTEELQAQQEELKAANEELEEQAAVLKQSEEKLQAQHEEMEVINEELEEKNELLERQKRDVEQARSEIAEKAEDLALASKYKSEFLANMSHELRTPLNSLLILARVFANNRDGNLTDDQIESARIIYNSGTDLLGLINDVLDLARIESGRTDLQIGTVKLSKVAAGIGENFQHVVEEKGLHLRVEMQPDAPVHIRTDEKRLNQIIKNLVANAIKFTEQGEVGVSFGRVAEDTHLPRGLPRDQAMAISIRDTGIGIEPRQQKVIFEAFQQADGGTARKYGGTGLGLSITRELVQLLGGEIRLASEPGKGSNFTVLLPTDVAAKESATSGITEGSRTATHDRISRAARVSLEEREMVEDDRANLADDDRSILIIDDDPRFAALLVKECHRKGFKSLVALTGEEGLALVESHRPNGIILDLRLPGMDGWSILELLKENPRTRHIPVHIMSVEDADLDALRKGAIGFLTKPPEEGQLDAVFERIADTCNGKPRTVLVVEDDAKMRQNIVQLIGDGDVQIREAVSGAAAIEALRTGEYNLMILDLGLPDMDGTQVLRLLESDDTVTIPPVIVHTSRDITQDEELELRSFSESIIIKDVRSDERLMDEISLFLHRVVSQMPDKKQKLITALHDVDQIFRGKKVLLVDDDMRTLFALSKILTAKGVKTLKAENGEKALQVLNQNPEIDLVLMDIMMPVMDGYETMRRIRAEEKFSKLPIIALTAKAMKEDQPLCIAAGASDYMPKPLDENRLYSMMRVWLYR